MTKEREDVLPPGIEGHKITEIVENERVVNAINGALTFTMSKLESPWDELAQTDYKSYLTTHLTPIDEAIRGRWREVSYVDDKTPALDAEGKTKRHTKGVVMMACIMVNFGEEDPVMIAAPPGFLDKYQDIKANGGMRSPLSLAKSAIDYLQLGVTNQEDYLVNKNRGRFR